MKDLPFFRWWIARAETDERYSAMTDQELGFYHRCLNKAWVNGGLPADLDQLAKTMRVTRQYLDEVWKAVGECWYSENGRLFNKTQEEERAYASSKSERNANAARSRYERSADALPMQSECSANAPRHASDSDSFSVSDSSSEIKKTTLREIPKTREVAKSPWPPGFDFAAWIEERDRKHPIPGKPQLAIQYAQDKIFVQFTPEQFDAAHDAWCEYWKGQDGGIPSLAVFINEAWWRKLPPKRAPPPKKEGFVEGVERVIGERLARGEKPW